MSSAAQLRKIKKPLIEKKRRERMNDCLSQLKTLVLEGRNTNTSEARYSKMEKVDILEMTVRYLQEMRHVVAFPSCPSGSPQTQTAKYIEGYSECASQVGRYLSSAKELNDDMRQRLSQHLVGSLRWTTPPARQSTPSADSQILSTIQPIAFPTTTTMTTDCTASTMLRTSVVQNPAVLSTTKFAVLETETGGLKPSTCSRVIIPLYLSSTCSTTSPSISPSPGQLLASATFQPLSAYSLFNPITSTPSASSSPNLSASSVSPIIFKSTTGSCDLQGNGVCCSSPRQGDECPSSSSIFTVDAARLLTQSFHPPTDISTTHPPNSPSALPAVATLHMDRWRQQIGPVEMVWRPWKDSAGKTS